MRTSVGTPMVSAAQSHDSGASHGTRIPSVLALDAPRP